MSKKLLKSSSIFSLMTFVSRIFGFIRDMVAAYIFGAGYSYDAFILAFKIPNMMRRLFAEGAFSQAFVPIISEYKTNKSGKEIQNFVNHIAGNLLLILFFTTVLGIVFSPFIIKVFAPGFDIGGDRLDLASSLLKITFPYMLFISLTAFLGGILNSYGKFAGPAFTPVFLNISLIIAAVFFADKFSEPIFALAWGVFIGGVMQLLFQIPFLLKLKLLPKPKINWQDPGVRRVLLLMGPAVFGAAVSQINSLVDTLFASFLPAGSISWLYYADRLMEFPLGVFGVGLATVVLPSLSQKFALSDKEKFADILDWGIRWVLLVGIPAMCGLYVLAGPLVVTLFKSGKFTVNDTIMTQQCLVAYSLAIVGIMLAKVLSSAFYASQDIKTPVKVSVIVILCNVVLNACLIKSFAHVGLAFATSVSSCINALVLLAILKKKQIYVLQRESIVFILRILFSSLAFIWILKYITPSMPNWLEWDRLHRLYVLLPLISIGAATYAGMLMITGLRPRHVLKSDL